MPSTQVNLSELARRLARRDSGAEANLQADVQTLLLYGGLNLGEQDLNQMVVSNMTKALHPTLA